MDPRFADTYNEKDPETESKIISNSSEATDEKWVTTDCTV